MYGYLNERHLSLSTPVWIYGLMKLKNSCLGQLPPMLRSSGDMSGFICSHSENQLTRSGETAGKLTPDSCEEKKMVVVAKGNSYIWHMLRGKT